MSQKPGVRNENDEWENELVAEREQGIRPSQGKGKGAYQLAAAGPAWAAAVLFRQHRARYGIKSKACMKEPEGWW